MIYVIEDDRGWETYYRRIFRDLPVKYFHDGVEAVAEMDDERPDVVLLDILLNGPTGFAILNEMQSYPELANVPIIVVSSVQIAPEAVLKYGVVKVFDKGEMTPQELSEAVKEALNAAA